MNASVILSSYDSVGLEIADSKVTPSYEDHSTISIINDADFALKAQAEIWSGDGSIDTPYRIEGYNITADTTCISISDTTVHFVISDCYLTAGFDMGMMGISLDNVTNGRVENCVIEYSFMGISLYESPGNVITNCHVNYGSETGIQLSNSPHNTISECYIYHCGDGFNIYSSDFVTIASCTIWDSYNRGVYVSMCENTILDGCDIYDNAEYSTSGVYFYNSGNSTVKSNNIFDNYVTGLHLYNAFLFDIYDNNIFNNSETGIKLSSSCNMINITENSVYHNGWWDSILLSPGGIFTGVMINLTIHKNTIFNNSQNGILMNGTYKPIITENDIFDNPQCAIYADHVNEAHVEMNHIYGNGWNSSMPHDNGIYATYCDEWEVLGNEIVDNSHSGMIFYDSFGHLIENNFVNWSVGYGIALVGTTDTVITGNHLIGHLSNCIRVTQAHRSNITNNIIQGSNSSVRVLWSEDVLISHNIIWGALTFGVWLDTATNCTIYYNDVGWNGVANAIDDQGTGNVWDYQSIGNWWHDYIVGSGPYNISDLSHIGQNQDNHPNRSIEILDTAAPLAYEMSSTGNTMEFVAAALNPLAYEVYANGSLIDSGDWLGGAVVADVDGLSAGYHIIQFRAIHFSGNYETTYSSVTVQDLTPPEWIVGPHDQILHPGEALSQQLEAFDPSGIGEWYTNDSLNFAISETGLLTNNTILVIGDYGLRVFVEDVFGNVQDWEIRIRVYPSTTTTTTSVSITSSTASTTLQTSPTTSTTPTATTTTSDITIYIIIGAGGVLIIIIIVIISRRR